MTPQKSLKAFRLIHKIENEMSLIRKEQLKQFSVVRLYRRDGLQRRLEAVKKHLYNEQ